MAEIIFVITIIILWVIIFLQHLDHNHTKELLKMYRESYQIVNDAFFKTADQYKKDLEYWKKIENDYVILREAVKNGNIKE